METERPSSQLDVLRKPTGHHSSSTSIRSSAPLQNMSAVNPISGRAPIDTRTQPISLATFMGGRASGPRLNSHAPQVDAHDPTQYQRSISERGPHPTFGTGGVAMPGMASLAKATSGTSKPRARFSELPPVINTYSVIHEETLPPPRKSRTRERAISIPSVASSSSLTQGQDEKPVSPISARFNSAPSAARTKDMGTYTRNEKATLSHKRSIEQSLAHQRADSSTFSPKSPTITVSLARPILPEHRPSSNGPHISASQTPSKAFLRSPVQKEVTPSISRLQGRGFVQSMVKISANLETPPASTSVAGEKSPVMNGKRTPVLDRWQQNIPLNTVSPQTSPTPRQVRRPTTAESTPMAIEKLPSSKPISPRKSLKGSTSFSHLREEATKNLSSGSVPKLIENKSLAGLGSATTLHVYKPIPLQTPNTDELGYHTPRAASSEFPALSRTPLSHVRLFR